MGTTNYRYYHILSGLRGCYMPDNVYVVRVNTRRELKSCITHEAEHQSCDGAFVGLGKAQVTWAAAHAWNSNEAILPFGRRGGDRPYAITISRATRRDWLEHQKD